MSVSENIQKKSFMQDGTRLLSTLAWVWRPWARACGEFLEALEAAVGRKERPILSLIHYALLALAGWYLYVPVHELLHAAGCVLSGGEVQEVRIHPFYGGGVLEKILPFVRAGTGSAGRLVRFDTGGSDVVYFLTDFAPFLVTAFAALPCLRKARVERSKVWLALGTVLTIVLPVSLPGDLYEMGSILVGGIIAAPGLISDRAAIEALRSDDLFLLLGQFGRRFPLHPFGWGVAVGMSLLAGTLIGSLVLAASDWLAGRLPAASEELHK